MRLCLAILTLAILEFTTVVVADEQPVQVAGVYPHLVTMNNENECGIGGVVPWADRLWVITYAPHKPLGSSDKLYEIHARPKEDRKA